MMGWIHISAEAKERARQKVIARWADPEYRAKHVARLRAQGPTARAAIPKVPPEERRIRAKVKKELWRAKRDALGLPA